MVIIFIMSIYTKSADRCYQFFSPGVFLPSGEGFDFAAYRFRIMQAGAGTNLFVSAPGLYYLC